VKGKDNPTGGKTQREGVGKKGGERLKVYEKRKKKKKIQGARREKPYEGKVYQ